MEKLKIIIYREFLSKVRNRSFLILTFLSPLLMMGMVFTIFYLTKVNEEHQKEIAVIDNSSLAFIEALKDSEEIKYTDLTPLGRKQAIREAQKDNYDGVLIIPSEKKGVTFLSKNIEYHSEDPPGILLLQTLEKKMERRLLAYNLKESGIDIVKLELAKFDIDLRQMNFSGIKTSKTSNYLKMALGMGSGYLVMMFIIIYGNSVMRSVIEEKTSRIIEIIISSVKPFQLMLGKIIGSAAAGVLQFLIWGALLLVFSFVLYAVFNISPVIPSEGEVGASLGGIPVSDVFQEVVKLPLLKVFVFFIVYFLGGYFLYSSIYTAIGAAVDSETDTQQFLLPVMLPLMLAVYIGFASVMSDPHGPVARVFSIIPLTSSIVMLMRIPFGVPVWEIVLSLFLLLITFLLIVWFASKIYRIGILMYGKKTSYKDLFRWLKY